MSTINIALTSYPKRIKNCASVINSVLENTVLPDRIFLTLSHAEFPNWELNLPKDLYHLVMTSDRVVLNWVEDNTKSMKKVFPILPFLDDDDIIITVDDDMLLPRDFIESRMKDFNANGRKCPITSNHSQSVNLDNLVVQCYSLFQKKMLNNYNLFLTPTVLNTFNDDRTYLYLIHMNGYKLKPCSKWCVKGDVEKLDVMSSCGYKYDVGTKYDGIVAPVVKDLSGGRDIGECFNLFNESKKPETNDEKKVKQEAKDLSIAPRSGIAGDRQISTISPYIAKFFQYNQKHPVKHDLVYVLGRGSKFGNLEIKISITSMLKFCSHWIGNIYIVGENPRIRNPKVTHIYAPDITRSNKDANIIHKLLVAIQKIPKLSDTFLFCSDDILVTKKSDWEDFAPRYIFEYPQDGNERERIKQESKNNKWDTLMLETLDRFVGYRDHIYFYEPHILAPIHKKYFKEMCKQIDYTNQMNVIIMSLWFNWVNLKDPQPRFDHQAVFSEKIPDMSKLERHLTFNDKAFSVKKFRDGLIELVTMDEFKDQ